MVQAAANKRFNKAPSLLDLEMRAAAADRENDTQSGATSVKTHSRRDEILKKVRQAEQIEAARVAAEKLQKLQTRPKTKPAKAKRQKKMQKPVRKPIWPVLAARGAARVEKTRQSFRAAGQNILQARRGLILKKLREAEQIEAARIEAGKVAAEKRQHKSKAKPSKVKCQNPVRKPIWPILADLFAACLAHIQKSFRAVRQTASDGWRTASGALSTSVRQLFLMLTRYREAAVNAFIGTLAALRMVLTRAAKPVFRAAVFAGYVGLVGVSGYVLYEQAWDLPTRTGETVFAETVAVPDFPVWQPVAVVAPVPVILKTGAADQLPPELPPAAIVEVDPAPAPVIHDQALPRIAIVIDDLGLDRLNTRRAIDLPAPVTLAFLPYAPNVRTQAARADANGHELLVHMPMEPKQTNLDPGPLALMAGGNDRQLLDRLDWNLTRFPGFVGVNNHMGSRFTEQSRDMRAVLTILQERGLYYLDSRTTPRTVGQIVAREIGMRNARRDVFLDNVRDKKAIRRQLMIVELLASRRGQVIAIGHPYPETMAVLAEWAKDLEGRGFELVPLSDLMTKPDTPVQVAAAGAP